jgi:hypothetical protein
VSRAWPEALKLGDRGEQLAKKVLLPQLFPGSHIIPIERKDQRWLHADFLVLDNKRHLIEVKYDTYDTGNLVLETKLVYTSGQVVPGWLYRTKADYVLYILSAFQEAYLLPVDEVRLMVQESRLPAKTTTVHDVRAHFYLVPRDSLPFRKVRYGTERQKLERHLEPVSVG